MFGLAGLNILLRKHIWCERLRSHSAAVAQQALGERRGRRQALDEVQMLAHGPLQAHLIALQQCLTLAATTTPTESHRWIQEGQAQAKLLQSYMMRLHTTDTVRHIDLEQVVGDITVNLHSVYPSCACRVEVLGNSLTQLAPEGKQALILVLYNALQNAYRHAHPSSVLVQLQYAPDATILVVADDGCGFPIGLPRASGRGIRDMERVVREHSGTFAIENLDGRGTRVTATFPHILLRRGKGG